MTTSSTLSTMTPGNLALCSKSSDRESPIRNCLGWGGNNSNNSNNNSNVEIGLEPLATNHLNWRFENGLLRSVGADGFATNFCLGPTMASLDTQTLSPYELVLQDCPGSASTDTAAPDLTHGHQENIFARHSATQRSASSSTSMETTPKEAIDPDANPQPQEQQEEEHSKEQQPQDRHMRFLMGADGRIRSLGPVYDSSTTKDLVAEQPFCVTAEESSKAYLIPCFDHEDETHVYTRDSNKLETDPSKPPAGSKQIFKGHQQIFEPSPNSSFESFLLNWPVSDETDSDSQEIQVAYQLGYHGPLASQHGTTLDKFDSFAIRVTNSGQSLNFQSDVLETPIENQSGILSYPTSSLNVQAGANKMGAYLVGRSTTESIPMGLLASTSFEVYPTPNGTTTRDAPTTPEQQQQGMNWPWVHIAFWGLMLCLAILLKLHSVCRPNHKDHQWKNKNNLRESIATVDTNAATLAEEVTRELSEQQQPQEQQQSRDSFSYHHHHQRRRSSRRDSKARMAVAQRAMQELNLHRMHSNHSRISSNLHSNHSRSYSQRSVPYSNHSRGLPYSNHSRQEGPGSPTSVTRIDETQITLRTTDLSETNYLDDIESIDIESDDDIESDNDDLKADKAYEEYNDDDIEAQALSRKI